MKGGNATEQLTSPAPLSIATVASAGDIVIVNGSNRANSFSPYNLTAAICTVIAGDETFSDGTGIFLHLPRSAIVLISGSVVVMTYGKVTSALIARTSRGVPTV